jgi:hypothetical protein
LFTDEIIENLCREPHTARVVGVVPRGEYDRPHTSVFITAVSSAQWISGFFRLCARGNRRVLLCKPLLHGFRLLLVGDLAVKRLRPDRAREKGGRRRQQHMSCLRLHSAASSIHIFAAIGEILHMPNEV